jgi:hypothetical protein
MTDALSKACDLYSRTSRGPGNREYWAGYLGGIRVVIFRVNNPQPDGPTHTMFLAERKPRPERRVEPTRGQATNEAARENAESWSPQRRTAYAEKLVSEFQPDDEPFA